MAYTKYRESWPDTDGGTLITGAALEHFEEGIQDAHDVLGSLTGVVSLTQAQYDGLGTKDPNTLYLIVE